MVEMETTVWETDTPAYPSTSVLYPLAPVGVGTPFVESLTGYLKRLAQAHHLKVVDLVTFCSTQTDMHVLPSTMQKLSRIDGMTDNGQAWSALLGKLTCQEIVGCLTMSYWRRLLNPYRMLRQHHAWCPQCFTEAACRETPLYEPLAWRLQCVGVCIVHQCSLVERCPTCGSQFTSLSNWAVVGYCPKCQSWLGKSGFGHDVPSYNTEAHQQASAAGHLLSFASPYHPIQWNSMTQILPLLKQQHHITYVRLEKVLHMSTSALSTLLAGEAQPNLGVFTRLAVFSGEAFWKALTHSLLKVPPTTAPPTTNQTSLDHLLLSSQRLPSLRVIARQYGFNGVEAFRKALPNDHNALWKRIHAEQCQILEQALHQEPPVVLSKWAERHGYQTTDLYHHFYDLCTQVTERFRAYKEAHCRTYLQKVLSEQTFPNFAQICKVLNVGAAFCRRIAAY